MHGPPGLGKTTLGHVLAATAGYVAVEMNASDDRSKDKFKEKFEASTQVWLLKQLQIYVCFLLIKRLKLARCRTIDTFGLFLGLMQVKRCAFEMPFLCDSQN